MASVIFNTPYLSHPTSSSSSSSSVSPTIVTKSPISASLSTSQISCSRTLTIHFGSTPFSYWNGLRKNGFSIPLRYLKLGKRKKCKGKSGVFASLFGVGAPEALVIGVVALLVFGPKGLADVAKNLGKTLRAFQPTIREVSREFKSTLEKEIGLDELNNPIQGNYTPNTVKPPSTQVPPELSVTPPPATTTEDSQATTTTTAPGGSPEDSQETATAPGGSPDDSPETTVTPPVSMEDSQSTVDNSNGKKSYSSEDLLKITEEQLKAVASQQQKDQPPSDTPESET